MYFIDALISLWLCSPPPPLNDLIVSQLFRQRWIKPPGGLTTLPLSGDSGHPRMGCYAEALSARHLALNKDTRQLSTSPHFRRGKIAKGAMLRGPPPLRRWHVSSANMGPQVLEAVVGGRQLGCSAVGGRQLEVGGWWSTAGHSPERGGTWRAGAANCCWF